MKMTSHAKMRIKERYGVKWETFYLKFFKSTNKKSKQVLQRDFGVEVRKVKIDKINYFYIYDKKSEVIKTFLTEDMVKELKQFSEQNSRNRK